MRPLKITVTFIALTQIALAQPAQKTPNGLASEGEKIFRAWEKKYPSMRVRTIGQAMTPTVEVCVPRNLWGKASRYEKIAITYFAEDKVSSVKQSPELHTVGSPLAVPYQTKNLATIHSGAWYISSGIMRLGKSEVVSCDENEVHGDSDWAAEVSKARANNWSPVPESKKASVFRRHQ